MNIKQILKTIVKAAIAILSIKSVYANDEYTKEFICPTPNEYDCTKSISGFYFTEKGLLRENNSAVIEGVTWKMQDVFANSAPIISNEIDYYLAHNSFYKFEPSTKCCPTNMKICSFYLPRMKILNGLDEEIITPAKEESSVICGYETAPTQRNKYGILRFQLAAKGKGLYKKITSNYGKTFIKDSDDQDECFRCIDKNPSNCKVAATFFKDSKQENRTVSSSMCLVL